MAQQDKHFVGTKKQLILWKVLRKNKRVWAWQSDAWNLLGVWKKSRNKGWWFFELVKTEVKKNVLIFFIIGRKKWKKAKRWFNPQKQNCAVLCFCLKNTQIRYHLLRRSCKKTNCYFLASKNTFFFSEQKTEEFVWYHTDFSVHFCNFFL